MNMLKASLVDTCRVFIENIFNKKLGHIDSYIKLVLIGVCMQSNAGEVLDIKLLAVWVTWSNTLLNTCMFRLDVDTCIPKPS